jgi:TATA-box binding protein (TBP) (component of TFIID and TFIIIB)
MMKNMSTSSFPEPDFIDKINENEEMMLRILMRKKENPKNIPSAHPLKISVKTACCYINVKYNMKQMCRKLEERLGEVNNPIKTINYTKVETDIDDDKILVKNSKSNNNFYNSICISINIRENKNINLMIFTNGRITCTGSKNDDDGLNAVKLLVLEMKKIPEIFENVEDYNMVDIMNYDIVMINSNFFVGFFINNHKLYEILIRDRIIYQLFSSFDPRVYQGVKIYFMWNINQLVKNGVCICDKKCKLTAKKKRGEGNGDCRRISVAVFGTGKILIAGAKNDTQLIDTYNYIVKILQDNYIYIVQYSVEEKSKILNENIVKS